MDCAKISNFDRFWSQNLQIISANCFSPQIPSGTLPLDPTKGLPSPDALGYSAPLKWKLLEPPVMGSWIHVIFSLITTVQPRNWYCWSDSTFTCCETVEDAYCPVTVLLAIAIQCFALFTFSNSAWNLEILHEIGWFDSQEILNLLPPDVRFSG